MAVRKGARVSHVGTSKHLALVRLAAKVEIYWATMLEFSTEPPSYGGERGGGLSGINMLERRKVGTVTLGHLTNPTKGLDRPANNGTCLRVTNSSLSLDEGR